MLLCYELRYPVVHMAARERQRLTDDEFVVYNNRIPFERGLFPRNACESGGMADAPDLGSGAFGRGGSSPFSRTNLFI